jgi:hypothetical protein
MIFMKLFKYFKNLNFNCNPIKKNLIKKYNNLFNNLKILLQYILYNRIIIYSKTQNKYNKLKTNFNIFKMYKKIA